MGLEPRILAKVDGRLRAELRDRDSGLTARVPVSPEQWAVWKRYCDLVGVSVGGGLAVLVDHELASLVDEEIETLTKSVRSREAAVQVREEKVGAREEAVARREQSCAFRERHLESLRRRLNEREQQLDSRQQALELLGSSQLARAPVTTRAKPGRNQACWCNSGKKYKNCHLDSDKNS